MTNYALSAVCHCNCPGAVVKLENTDLVELQRIVTSGQFAGFNCNLCDCYHTFQNGVGLVAAVVACTPQIKSLGVLVGPPTGPAAGGTSVTIKGHCLDQGTLVVMFGSTPAASISGVSGGQATVVTPAHAVGSVDVFVQNERGQHRAKGKLSGAFTFT